MTGLPLSVLPEPERMEPGDAFIPVDADRRLRAHPAGAAWCRHVGDYDLFSRESLRIGRVTWGDVPPEVLSQVFDAEELRRLWWGGSVVWSKLDDHFERDPLLAPQFQIKNGMWQCGWTVDGEYVTGLGSELERARDDEDCDRERYNVFARFCVGLRRFDFGHGSETHLNHVDGVRGFGWGVYGQPWPHGVYLDGKLGLAVSVGGRHALTIGFFASTSGVLVTQVQLRAPRGNRWLYRLGRPVVEHAVGCLREALGLPTWLVTGDSAVAALVRSYGSSVLPDANTLERVRRAYARREGCVLKSSGREFALVAA